MALHYIEPLDLDMSIAQWFERMEAVKAVVTASTGNQLNSKTIAITSLGRTAMTLLQDLCLQNYDAIKMTPVNHLEKKKLELLERAVFYSMTQQQGETILSFYS